MGKLSVLYHNWYHSGLVVTRLPTQSATNAKSLRKEKDSTYLSCNFLLFGLFVFTTSVRSEWVGYSVALTD